MQLLLLPLYILLVCFVVKETAGNPYVKMFGLKVNILYSAIFLLMILTNGLRAVSVGVDTVKYYYYYTEEYGPSQILEALIGNGFREPLFTISNVVGNRLYAPFWVYLLAVSTFVFLCISLFISKYSSEPLLSLAIYIFLDYYILTFSMLRQTVAMSFCLLFFVIKRNDNRDIFRFLICLMAAFGFHASAIVFFPAYFFIRTKRRRSTFLILAVIAVASFISKDCFLGLIKYIAEHISAKFYKINLYAGGHYGLMYYLLLWAIVIASILCTDNNFFIRNEVWIYMLQIALILFPHVMGGFAAMRVLLYYTIFVIILLPNLLDFIKPCELRFIGKWVVLIAGSGYYYYRLMGNGYKLLPYRFFFQNLDLPGIK